MTFSIDEITDLRRAMPCHLEVIPEQGRKRLRGAIPLCNDCASAESVLSLIEEAAESF